MRPVRSGGANAGSAAAETHCLGHFCSRCIGARGAGYLFGLFRDHGWVGSAADEEGGREGHGTCGKDCWSGCDGIPPRHGEVVRRRKETDDRWT